MATIWRWREHFQSDFAARMDWCVAGDYKQANHNPVAVVNGDRSRRVLEISAKPGDTVRLSAEGTSDPDGQSVELRWWIYPEASTLREPKGQAFPGQVTLRAGKGWSTSLVAPRVEKAAAIHVILEARDTGTPPLWAYRRSVVTIQP
jgi:hypothetical protein